MFVSASTFQEKCENWCIYYQFQDGVQKEKITKNRLLTLSLSYRLNGLSDSSIDEKSLVGNLIFYNFVIYYFPLFPTITSSETETVKNVTAKNKISWCNVVSVPSSVYTSSHRTPINLILKMFVFLSTFQKKSKNQGIYHQFQDGVQKWNFKVTQIKLATFSLLIATKLLVGFLFWWKIVSQKFNFLHLCRLLFSSISFSYHVKCTKSKKCH